MTKAERDRLIEASLPAADGCFNRFMEKLGPDLHIDRDALQGAAREALVRCAYRFEPERGDFVIWAWNRMWGAMQDECRRIDWLPRSTRRQIRALEQVRDTIERETGRAPTNAELAAAAGVTVDEVFEAWHERDCGKVVSIQAPARVGGTDVSDATIADAVPGHYDVEEQVGTMDAFRHAWAGLNERERFVLIQLTEGASGMEVAEQLGVSESRVSQLRGQATGKLRVARGEPRRARAA